MPDAREELNRSVREGRIQSRHSIKSLEGMGSSSHDLVAELKMHCASNKCRGTMFRSNVSSKFLYFVGKEFDENIGKVSNRVNGWQYFRWMSIWECINYLEQFFTGRCQRYSFSVKFTFSCVHNFWNLVFCLCVQVLENSQLCVPPFPLCLTSFSLSYKKFISYWLKPWRGVVSYNFLQRRGCMLI